MYTDTMALGLNEMGKVVGAGLDAHQLYSLTRCIEMAKMSEISLEEFMEEFIEDKHPDLRDYVVRTWYLA